MTHEAEALTREFAKRGIRAFTREQYSRQGMLDAIRENQRRYSGEPHTEFLREAAQMLADDIAEVVGLPAADIATVLLAAGGSVGVLAELNGLCGTTVAGVLQHTAEELDRRASGGDQP
ncbi:hypothetical protein ACF1BS_04520 [Streptomyces sp. NPDC014748]|uniref:hypothetical protein n=1 Tax=Streptomyces sp. NPDC014748 TaxID=3364905 RepID=UPI0036F85508